MMSLQQNCHLPYSDVQKLLAWNR